MRQIGTVYDITSTSEFIFMLDEEISQESLVFSYVELNLSDNEKIIARIVDVKKENPLISKDIAGVLAKQELLEDITFSPLSERFTYGYAECEVVGILKNGRLQANRKPIQPGEPVYSISDDSVKSIFYDTRPAFLPIGRIESFGTTNTMITINGDEIASKHFAIFGMTGSGKTTTSAKVIEELINRLHRIVIFDPHDDYINISDYSFALQNKGISIEEVADYLRTMGISIENEEVIPLFINIAILLGNKSLYEVLPERINNELSFAEDVKKLLESNKIEKIKNSDSFKRLNNMDVVEHIECFPEIRFYGNGFEDFTINLMASFLNENFSGAQRRVLRRNLTDSSLISLKGLSFLQRLYSLISNDQRAHRETINTLQNQINTLQTIYTDLLRSFGIYDEQPISNHKPLADIEELSKLIASRQINYDKYVFRISLSSLPENIRKAYVYAITDYLFRRYKYNLPFKQGDEIIGMHKENRFPILFILEEARTLIPRRANIDTDYAGFLAVRSLRNLAFEGRKFRLAYGLISQKPSNIDEEVGSQCNTLILHQLKNPDDQSYVRQVTEGLTQKEIDLIKNIGTGKAIITGTAVKSTILVSIENRYSKEGIETPKPVSENINQMYTNLKQELNLS